MDEKKRKIILVSIAGLLLLVAAYAILKPGAAPKLDPELQKKLDAERAANPDAFKAEPDPPGSGVPGMKGGKARPIK
ncbi:MAG: hypothetical protein ACREJO_02120 [Phycisphaerales bacterium]